MVLAHAYQLLANGTGRVGDALSELMNLPSSLTNSELVLRLQLLVFGQTGYREEFDSVVAKLAVKR